MIHASAQRATRRTRSALLVAVLLVVALVPLRAAAQCPASENHFLFGHSWFRGTHWMRTLREHQVTIADSVCSLDIAAVSFAGADTANFAVLATRDGSVFLMRMVRRRPSFICGLPSLTLETPRALGASMPLGTPFSLVNHPSYRRDSVLLAVRVGTLRIRAYTIQTATASVTDSGDITLTDAGGQQVRAIAGDADTVGGADSGIWAVGDGGLIRHIPFDGATWGGEQTYDIAGAVSLRCIGEGYAGSDNGSVYAFDGNGFVFDERPVIQSLQAIGRRAAVGAGGAVAVHRGGQWDGYTAAATQFVAYNPVAHGNGSSIELLDTAWQYQLFTYEDTPTALQATSPAAVYSYINVTPYVLNADSLELALILADPDSNQSPPAITVRSWSFGHTNLLVSAQHDTLVHRQPHVSSQFGVVQLDDYRVSLKLRRDSVSFSAQALRAAPIFMCTTSYWAIDTFTTTARWGQFDTIEIALRNDTLRIVNEVGAVAALTSPRASQGPVTVTIAGLTGRSAAVSLPAGVSAADIARVELFDARGRLLATSSVRDSRITLAASDRSLASRVVYLRFVLRDGTRFGKPLLLSR